jgi:hypothetical protein
MSCCEMTSDNDDGRYLSIHGMNETASVVLYVPRPPAADDAEAPAAPPDAAEAE